jgi:DNA invertase Pin-like site-specific DNA recombinase
LKHPRVQAPNRQKFVVCDMPEANDLTIHIIAAFAEHEAKRISERTKDTLAVARARGQLLGRSGAKNLRPNIEFRKVRAEQFAERLRTVVAGFRQHGMFQRAIMAELNKFGVRAPNGGIWSLTQVQRLLRRLHTDLAAA